MKNYYILTLFPDMIMNGLNTSITGRAKANGLINFDAVNIRDFTKEKHGASGPKRPTPNPVNRKTPRETGLFT